MLPSPEFVIGADLMYQKVIRDPSGQGLIRIVPVVCDDRNAVVDGSILLVPAGTVAFVSINGILSSPYPPGRHSIFTGTSPFFVRFRNIMTHGDAAVSVSVFYISTDKNKFMQLGTGEIPFHEHRFKLTMMALASCTLAYSVKNPETVLKKLVGAYSNEFCEDDIEPCLTQLILSPIKEALSRELANREICEFNAKLSAISCGVRSRVSAVFGEYGLEVRDFNVTGINIPDGEMQRLSSLEAEYASGVNRTDLEKYNLDSIWKGDVDKRTLSEAITGISSRASNNAAAGDGSQSSCGTDNAIKLLLLSQLFPSLREGLGCFTGSAANGNSPSQKKQSEAPPPMPCKTATCPSCKKKVYLKNGKCCSCGRAL